MALSAATITPVRPLSQQTCHLAPRLWLPRMVASAYTAGGRRKPCIRYGSSRPDGGDWFRRQITYRFHSRRRAAQPETEPNDAGKRIRQTKLMVLLRTFFEVHKGWHIQYNIVSRERCWMRKTSDQYRDLVVRVAGYSRLLHRAVAGCAGRYHRPYRTYAVIYLAPSAICPNCLMAFNRPTQAC